QRDDIDVFVELMGGVETPFKIISEILKKNKPVVTANKAMLAYTYQKSKHKFSDTESLETGGAQSGQSQFAQLPEHYANLDMGV
ncbi:hypothetical protein VWN77_10910, partial [Campylobacter coli]